MKMKTVKTTFYTLGDRTSDLARTIGDETVDLARRFGDGTMTLAKRVGPKRGLIGLATAVAVIGGSIMLVRYLKARNAQQDGARDEHDEHAGASSFANKRARARNAAESHISHQ
ncbi:MAG TPA: hypothetical protein VFP84_33805 [Kofleriaceae bacterium]|nr:hypothetical protein [Kofleriaceae bacterium]